MQQMLADATAQATDTGRMASSSPQASHGASLGPGSILQGKYTILDVLGSGSNATAYRASTADGKVVAIKALSMSGMKEWKQLDLFQREAKVLASLQHPSIPRYIDYFEQDSEGGLGFFIVQEAVAGKTLAQMVAEGMRATDAEVTRIAEQLLEVLEYLGGLRPVVIHRDVKVRTMNPPCSPQNQSCPSFPPALDP
jgi:serine/threonine protein kinase